jgi:hypothetical protein
VLSLKPSHAWWHPIEEVGWVEGVAQAAYWGGPDDPGEWVKLQRCFRDGHKEAWWALEAELRVFSLWRNRGGWSWRVPIPPRCRAEPVGSWRATFPPPVLREPTTAIWRRQL